jgi:hypothetical protein
MQVPCSEDFFKGFLKFDPLIMTTESNGCLILADKKDMAYFMIGTGEDSVCLLWKAIECMQKMGIKALDLVGVNIPGISRYKTGMGGKLVSYIGI